MATFTSIPKGSKCKITVDPQARIAEINKNIYGGFIERKRTENGMYDLVRD